MKQTLATSAPDREDDGQIEIVRVKLLRAQGTAIVAELHAADKLVVSWAADEHAEASLAFEVMFDNGYAFGGRFDYDRSKKNARSFSLFMRDLCERLWQVPATWPNGMYVLSRARQT